MGIHKYRVVVSKWNIRSVNLYCFFWGWSPIKCPEEDIISLGITYEDISRNLSGHVTNCGWSDEDPMEDISHYSDSVNSYQLNPKNRIWWWKKDMIHMDLGKVQQTSAEVTPNCGEKYGKSPPNARNHSSFFFRNFCRKSAPDVWWFVAFNDFSLFPPSCWNREIIQSLSSTGRTSTGYLTNETMDWPFRLENLRALRGKEVSYWWWDTLIEQFDIIVTCFCWYLIMIMIMVMM